MNTLTKLVVVLFLIFSMNANSAVPEITIRIKNHVFQPSIVNVPANTKVKLLVINEDNTPEEFESYELNREKIVSGKGKISVFIGPLKPGKYPFFGEFNPKTAQGMVIVK